MKELPQNMAFIMNLWTINSIISKKIDACLGSIHGIGFTEFMVLFHLGNALNKSMRRIDLAKSIGLSASGITRLITPMEKIGLVQKEQNPRDARVSFVKLSSGGEKILKEATASLKSSSQQLLHDIEDKKLTNILEVLKSLGGEVFIK